MRVVIDTNVVASRSLSPHGNAARIFAAWRTGAFDVLASEPILAEYRRALGYERVRRVHGMSESAIARMVGQFQQFAIAVAPIVPLAIVLDDPSDDKFLECAVAGGADYIISGDRHLRSLGDYEGIRILTPVVFVTLLDEAADGETPLN